MAPHTSSLVRRNTSINSYVMINCMWLSSFFLPKQPGLVPWGWTSISVTKLWVVDLLSPGSCKNSPPWIRPVCQANPTDVDSVEILGIWFVARCIQKEVTAMKLFFFFHKWCTMTGMYLRSILHFMVMFTIWKKPWFTMRRAMTIIDSLTKLCNLLEYKHTQKVCKHVHF